MTEQSHALAQKGQQQVKFKRMNVSRGKGIMHSHGLKEQGKTEEF